MAFKAPASAGLSDSEVKKPERLVLIQNEIHELEAQMKKFYARRTKDVKTKLTPRRIYSR